MTSARGAFAIIPGQSSAFIKPDRMPRPPPFSSRYFDRRAAAYEQHAAIPTEVAGRLLERLDGLRFEPGRILEVGCADGRQCLALQQRFPQARVIGLDYSAGMLGRARGRQRWWRKRFDLLRADGGRLPLATDSIDLVYANLSLGWLADLPAALQEWRRVLRPGGLLLASVYGPDTLGDWQRRLMPTASGIVRPDVQQLGALLVGAGFYEPVLDTDWIRTVHADPADLAAELRGCGLLPAAGAGLAGRDRRSALTALAAWPDPSETPCRANWEIVSASAWAPDPGQPIRSGGGEEVSVPVSAIGIRRRD